MSTTLAPTLGKLAVEWNMDPSSVAKWGLGGLAVGAGARLAKYIADVARDRDVSSAVDVKKQTLPVSEIPVEVSPEEAAQLKQKGITVKEANSVTDTLAGAGLGALGVAGVYGGWRALDKTFDKKRKTHAKQRLERARTRVERLLNDTPEAQDVKLAAAMHAAEEVFFSKQANPVLEAGVSALAYPLTYIAPGIGAIGALAAVAGYNRAKDSNKNRAKAKQLRDMFVERRRVDTPVATMVPVLKKKESGQSPAQQAQTIEA